MKRTVWLIVAAVWIGSAASALADGQEYQRFKQYVKWSL